MPTLGSQPERLRHTVDYATLVWRIEILKELAKAYNLALADVIAIYVAEIQAAKIQAYVDNGDIEDENLAGLGDIFAAGFSELREAIEKLASVTD